MNIRLLAPAADELEEAVASYAAQAPGLERRFIDDIRTARKRVSDRPEACGQSRRHGATPHPVLPPQGGKRR
jgi:plasmid stabilization system protein ParE